MFHSQYSLLAIIFASMLLFKSNQNINYAMQIKICEFNHKEWPGGTTKSYSFQWENLESPIIFNNSYSSMQNLI